MESLIQDPAEKAGKTEEGMELVTKKILSEGSSNDDQKISSESGFKNVACSQEQEAICNLQSPHNKAKTEVTNEDDPSLAYVTLRPETLEKWLVADHEIQRFTLSSKGIYTMAVIRKSNTKDTEMKRKVEMTEETKHGRQKTA